MNPPVAPELEPAPELRVVVAAGGTAGHVIPALAIAEQFRRARSSVTFVGGDRAEAELVPTAGFDFEQLRIEGASRTNPLKALRAIWRAAVATGKSVRLIGRLRPDVVIGGGGYAALPVGVAAVLRRTPLVLTEADSHLGVTNRLLARFAKRVCLAFPIEGREGQKYVVTGRPIPAHAATRSEAREAFEVSADRPCVVVFGGSLGARSINLASPVALADTDCDVIHLTGRRDFESVKAPRPGYQVFELLSPERFALVLAAADLAIARAGGSVFELSAAGLPMVLVPYPYASGDHQAQNAAVLEACGAAQVIKDQELGPEQLARTVSSLLANRSELAEMANASRGFAKPNAAYDVAELAVKVARGAS